MAKLSVPEEKKTAISQDWWHKKEKNSQQRFGKLSVDVGTEAVLSEFELHYLFTFSFYWVCFFLSPNIKQLAIH